MADIFLSYASPEDHGRVKPLVDALQAEGWSIWWDRELVAGPSFNEKIQAALNAARCVVVVWSQHSIKSRWCQDEANEGLEREVLIPVRIDDVRPPLGFRSSQTASLMGWPQQHGELDRLLAGIRECLGSSPESVAAPSIGVKRSIAVLPFANMSNDPDQEFFADGIAEELINALVALGDLDVIARTSSFQFKNRNEDVRQIASALGVSHVLEGSVRKSGETVRVTAQLIEGASGMHLWSDRYDRNLTDNICRSG